MEPTARRRAWRANIVQSLLNAFFYEDTLASRRLVLRIAVALTRRPVLQCRRGGARRGRSHACLWTFDVSDYDQLKPLAVFQVSELESPWSREPGAIDCAEVL
jgi:hypothetical protein